MKIWIDANNSPPNEEYIPTESVAEAGLWVVLCEAFCDTARSYNDIKGVRKWKVESISVPNDKQIAIDMGAWLVDTNRFYPICTH